LSVLELCHLENFIFKILNINKLGFIVGMSLFQANEVSCHILFTAIYNFSKENIHFLGEHIPFSPPLEL
jgi:hypothetical protein